MVAMALSCQITVRAYRLRELWLCRTKAVRTSRDGNYGCFAPKLCGRIEARAKLFRAKTVRCRANGTEGRAKIGVILALRGWWSGS